MHKAEIKGGGKYIYIYMYTGIGDSFFLSERRDCTRSLINDSGGEFLSSRPVCICETLNSRNHFLKQSFTLFFLLICFDNTFSIL